MNLAIKFYMYSPVSFRDRLFYLNIEKCTIGYQYLFKNSPIFASHESKKPPLEKRQKSVRKSWQDIKTTQCYN